MRRPIPLRVRLIASTAIAACAPGLALAQGFEASSFVQSGGAVIATAPGLTTVTVSSAGGSTAVIRWTPFDSSGTGPIDFLPAGATGRFINDASASAGYTVINRVIPIEAGRPIQFNGTVESLISSGGVTRPGGTILFYSPAGVIVGPGAGFDIGNLVLTTADPIRIAGGFRLVSAAGSAGTVDVQAGATLTASQAGSYIALVAPRVRMNGQTNVNGIAAYVAAEGADITIDAGLYAIAVSAGTEPAGSTEILTHGGVTALGDPSVARQRAVMVAMSKNDAIAMLVGGQVTLAAATGAVTEGPDVLLVSGFPGVSAGGAVSVPAGSDVNPDALADIALTATTMGAPLTAEASNAATLLIDGVDAVYDGSLFLLGRRSTRIDVGLELLSSLTINGNLGVGYDFDGRGRTADVRIAPDATLTVTGDFGIDLSDRGDPLDAGGLDARGGEIAVDVGLNARLVVGGALSLIADATGADRDTLPGGSGDGGSAALRLDAFSVATIGGDVLIRADGEGYGDSRGGFGGDARLENTGGDLFADSIIIRADGRSGGRGERELVPDGGGGGVARLLVSGSSSVSASNATVSADFSGAGERGRSGQGGLALVQLRPDAGASMTIAGLLDVSASAQGGGALLGAGGTGTGGAAEVLVEAGSLVLTSAIEQSALQLRADGIGGAGGGSAGFAGGAGAGGTAQIAVASGGLVGRGDGDGTAPTIAAIAQGLGGAGSPGGSGGTGLGGSARMVATDGGLLGAQSYLADATGIGASAGAGLGDGGAAGAGGEGNGGQASIEVLSASAARLISNADDPSQPGELTILAAGFGGQGGAGADSFSAPAAGAGGAGGVGSGGTTTLLVGADASVRASGFSSGETILLHLDAAGYGGNGGGGGAALGVGPSAGGTGGGGGRGRGGTARTQIEGLVDRLDEAFGLIQSGNGLGGDGGFGGRGDGTAAGGGGGAGGSGRSGSSLLLVEGSAGAATLDSLRVTSRGVGGAGGLAAPGGAGGAGGAALFDPLGSASIAVLGSARLTAGEVLLSSDATGGAGAGTASYDGETVVPGPGGAGGDARALAVFMETGRDTILAGLDGGPALTLSASATGGAGGDGANTPVGLSAGDGGAGGLAVAAAVTLTIGGVADVSAAQLVGDATGGAGGRGGTAPFDGDPAIANGDGGRGGDATGGTLSLGYLADALVADGGSLTLRSDALAGMGGAGGDAPDETDPAFVSGVLANGPVYDFGRAGDSGDVTAGSANLASELASLSLGLLAMRTQAVQPLVAIGAAPFVDAGGVPRVGTTFGAEGVTTSGALSRIDATGGALTAFDIVAEIAGSLTLTGATIAADFVTVIATNTATIAAPLTVDAGLSVRADTIAIEAETRADTATLIASDTTIRAPLAAREIEISTVAIAVGAAVGDADTLAIRITGNATAEIGGSRAGGAPFSLLQDEVARLRATQITIRGTDTVRVDTLLIGGAASATPNLNPARDGLAPAFAIGAAGALDIAGEVRLIDAASDHTLGLLSLVQIGVQAERGYVAVRDVGGGLSGRLYLRAPLIYAASADTLGAVLAAGSAEERNIILRDARDVLRPEGFLQADRISLRPTDTYWGANSADVGAPFAGLSVGRGGLDIAARGVLNIEDLLFENIADADGIDLVAPFGGPAEVIGFGRGLIDGALVTGAAFTRTIDVTGDDVTPDSRFDDCLFFGACGAFEGDATVDRGDVAIDRSGARDIITVGAAGGGVGIITWSPFDSTGSGPIDFLPAGRSALFQGAPGLGSFTAINRVLPLDPSRPIALNGTVQARLRDAGGEARQGGRVIFFSPGGVIAGAGALFDIGQLILTTGDPFVFGDTAQLDSDSADAFVLVEPGAVIDASAAGGSVALVAPSVSMFGDVRVGSVAAYVAANSVDLTIRADGTYAVEYDFGSLAPPIPTVLSHGGATTGPAFERGTILLAAQPLFDAPTEISVSGTLGFDGGAGAIVVAGGLRDPSGRGLIGRRDLGTAAFLTSDLLLGQGDFGSPLFADGGAIRIAPDGDARFDQPVTLTAAGDFTIESVGTIRFAGGLVATAAGAALLTGGGLIEGGDLAITGQAGVAVETAVEASGLLALRSADRVTARVAIDTPGSLEIVAGGAIELGDVRAGAAATIQSDLDLVAGNFDVADDLSLEALGAIEVGAVTAGSLLVESDSLASGGIDIGGAARITTLNAIAVDGDLFADSLEIATLDAGGSVLLGGTVAVAGDATLDLDGFTPREDGATVFRVLGDLTAGALSLRARRGEMRFEGALTIDGTVVARGGDGLVVVGPVIAGGIAADLNGRALFESEVNVLEAVAVRTAGPIDFNAGLTARSLALNATSGRGGIALAGPVAIDGAASLTATADIVAQDLFAADMLAIAAGGDARLVDARFREASVLAGRLAEFGGAAEGGALTVAADRITIGDATLSRDADLRAATLATLTGRLSARTIVVEAGDIAIGADARIGGASTEAVRFLATVTSGDVVAGGDPATGGFNLDAGELARVRADRITVDAGASDLIVRGLTLRGSLSEAPNLNGSVLELTSGRDLRVDGAIAIVDAGALDMIRLEAGRDIHVVSPTGSLAVRGPSEALTGGARLLARGRVTVASDSAAARLRGEPSFADRRAILIANDGPVRPQGYIEAGEIEIRAGTRIHVQNSGPAGGAFAGLTAGGGGLTVGSFDGARIEVIGFGRGIVDGIVLTGFDFTRTIEFDAADITADSEWNDCKLERSASCGGGAFQGEFVVERGGVSVVRTATLDVATIAQNSEANILRWTPTDVALGGGAIDFLPAANTGVFRGVPGLDSYVVINRVIPRDPGRAIALNGRVQSELVDSSGVARPGGTVMFFSPGGVILGPTARFDVGSLLLTTGDLIDARGDGRVFSLSAAAGSAGAVEVEAGAEVRALSEGAFVALFGPRIRHFGSVEITGTAAFVAAEAAGLTFGSDGTYRVAVTRGTAVGSAVDAAVGPEAQQILQIGGSVGGAATGAARRSILAVAAPSDGVASMLLTGAMGFGVSTAGAADILLAAGVGGSGVNGAVSLPASGGIASVALRGGSYTSNIRAFASRSVSLYAGRSDSVGDSGVSLELLGGLVAEAAFGTSIGATDAFRIAIAGDVTARPGDRPARGLFQLVADGGEIAIGGSLDAFAPALTIADLPRVVGGEAAIRALDDGLVSIGGDVRLDASGAGGPLSATLVSIEPGRGGTAVVEAGDGGRVEIGGAMTIVADGAGTDPRMAATTRGGIAELIATGGGGIRAGDVAIRAAGAPGGDVSLRVTGGGRIETVGDLIVGDVSRGPDTLAILSRADGLRIGGALVAEADLITLAGGGEVRAGTMALSFGRGLVADGLLRSGDTLSLVGLAPVDVAALAADGAVEVTASTTLGIGAIDAASVSLSVFGDVAIRGPVTVDGAFDVFAGRLITTGLVQAGSALIETGDLRLGPARFAGAVFVATGTAEFQSFSAGSLRLASGTSADFAGPVAIGGAADIRASGRVTALRSFAAASLTIEEELVDLGGSTIGSPVDAVDFSALAVDGFVGVNISGMARFGSLTAQEVFIESGGAAFGALVADRVSVESEGPILFAGPARVGALGARASGEGGRIDVSERIDAARGGTLSAFGRVTVAAQVTGSALTISAGDVAITSTGSVGGAGTSRVTFRTDSSLAAGVTVGGAGGGTGFVLDAAELLRVRANDIVIDSGFGRGPTSALDIVVAGFALEGSASATPNLNGSTLSIASGRGIRVTGPARIVNAGASDALALLATTDLRFELPGGEASVTAPGGALAGRLYLLGRRVTGGLPGALAAFDAGATGAALRDAFAINTGAVRPEGYLQADRIDIRAADAFLSQNTGRTGLFAGLSVGTGGLDLRQGVLPLTDRPDLADPAALDRALGRTGEANIVAFGRQAGAGEPVVNAAFLPLVRFVPADVTEASEVNGCLLRSGDCGSAPPEDDIIGRIEMLTTMVTRPGVESVLSLSDEDEEDEGEPGPSDQPVRRAGDSAPPIIVPILDSRLVDPTAVTVNGDIGDPAGGVGNEATWTSDGGSTPLSVTPASGAGGDAGAVGGTARGMGNASSVGSERNPGLTGDDGAGGSDGGAIGGAGGSSGNTNSVGSERNPGTTGDAPPPASETETPR